MFNIPNTLTIANLFFGCCAIVHLVEGQYDWSISFVLAAALVDFLDGFVARSLKMETTLGAQLDSLSDVVSFGVVPALYCFHILESIHTASDYLSYVAFLIALMAAFRLARFNVSSSGKDLFFSGLPVPANALFFAGILFLFHSELEIKGFVLEPVLFLLIILLFSFFMVSEMKILKIHLNKEWLKTYGFIPGLELITLASWFWFGAFSLSLVIIVHIVFSLFMYKIKNKQIDL